jgi:hypothetical protein
MDVIITLTRLQLLNLNVIVIHKKGGYIDICNVDPLDLVQGMN